MFPHKLFLILKAPKSFPRILSCLLCLKRTLSQHHWMYIVCSCICQQCLIIIQEALFAHPMRRRSYNYSWLHVTFSFDRYFKYFIPHIGHKCWLACCKNIVLSLEADRATGFQSTTDNFEMFV